MNRIHSLSTTAEHGHSAAALFAVVLALATLANAAAMPSAHSHKGKKGSMKITAPTEVGGILFPPGDYRVREVDSLGGPAVEFVRQTFDLYAPEGTSSYGEEVVGQVKVTEQALSSAPKHTQLKSAPDSTDAIALEIRGSDVEYLFATPESTATPDAMASHMNADPHE